MFKQLSQLGKNLTDELQKGLSDELIATDGSDTNSVSAGSNIHANSDIDKSLPVDIQTKLKKFEKYESKYPLLLNAYKKEKAKNRKLDILQKILTENTPISDLSDIDKSLPSYFEDINSKFKILNEEIKRLNKLQNAKKEAPDSTEANTNLQDESLIGKYKAEIEELKLKLDESEGDKKHIQEINEVLKAQRTEIANLNKKLLSINTNHEEEINNIQRQASNRLDEMKTKLQSEITDYKNRLNKSIEETKIYKKQVDEFDSKVSNIEGALKKERDHSASVLEEKNDDIKKISTELETSKEQTMELKKTISDKEAELAKINSNLAQKLEEVKKITEQNEKYSSYVDQLEVQVASLKKELEATSPKETISEPAVTTSNTQSSGSKKNKKNNQTVQNSINTVTSPDVSIHSNSEVLSCNPSDDNSRLLKQQYADLSKEFQEFKKAHSNCEDWKSKLEILEKETSIKQDSIQKELAEAENTSTQLTEELQSLKTQLKAKNIEVEEVRDMLREVGNELVDARDQLKDTNSQNEKTLKLQNDIKKLEDDITNFKKREGELLNTITSLEEDISKAKELQTKEKNDSQKEINSLKIKLVDLQSQNKTLNIQTKELTSLKINFQQKEKTIAYLEKQVKDFTTAHEVIKRNVDSLKRDNIQLTNRVGLLKKENESLNNEIKNSNHSYEEHLRENGKLSERLSILQEKYDTLQDIKSNSNEQISSIKRQCEELGVKLKESNKRIISLENELSEYTTLIQDKTKESDTMRRLLSNLQNEDNEKYQNLETKISILSDEKSRLESQLALQYSKHTREQQGWRHTNDDLQAENQKLTNKLAQLNLQIEQLKEANSAIKKTTLDNTESSADFEKMITNLKMTLSKADIRIHDLQNSNNQLLETNNSINKKLDRLTRSYKSLSSQYNALKEGKVELNERTSRSNSVSSQLSALTTSTRGRSSSNSGKVSIGDYRLSSTKREYISDSKGQNETEAKKNEKIEYIKNVLLGFLEHKEQRNQLLPVVSMLLQFDSNDEKRLLASIN